MDELIFSLSRDNFSKEYLIEYPDKPLNLDSFDKFYDINLVRKVLFTAKRQLSAEGSPGNQMAIQHKIDEFTKLSKDHKPDLTTLSPSHLPLTPDCYAAQSSLLGCPGLFASKSFSPGDKILQIPEEYIISVNLAKQDPRFSATAQELIEKYNCHPDTVLLVYLCFLRRLYLNSPNPHGILSDWFNFRLPQSPLETGSLLAWDIEDIEDLGVSQISQRYTYEMDILIKCFMDLPDIPICQEISMEDFLYMKCLCMTRSFSVSDDLTVLIPNMDMMNHHFHAQTSFPKINPETKAIEIFAETSIQKDTEIFLHYYGLPNIDMFFNMGFFMQKNSMDKIEIDLSTGDKDETGPLFYVRRGFPFISDQLMEIVDKEDLIELLEGMKIQENPESKGFAFQKEWNLMLHEMTEGVKFRYSS
jgi:SET domain